MSNSKIQQKRLILAGVVENQKMMIDYLFTKQRTTTLSFLILSVATLFLTACSSNDITGMNVKSAPMADMACHVMGGQMMGNCSQEDIQRLTPFLSLESQETFLPSLEGIVGDVKPTKVVVLQNNEVFKISAEKVTKEINKNQLTMYGYNGRIPGPILKVEKGSSVYIEFTNNIDMPTTVHWHGLRLENKFDGVPGLTQEEVPPGGTFLYKLDFPDEGFYWYHPHVREDIQQDLGLYGGIIVYEKDEIRRYTKEEVLFLDDMLLNEEGIVPYGKNHSNYAVMGRFGNTMLINGKEEYTKTFQQGDLVRFYVIDVANVRPFNISIASLPLKLVGSDVGFYEQEQLIKSFLITPAERYIVDVLFDKPGVYKLYHTTPETKYTLGEITVESNVFTPSEFFDTIRNEKVYKDVDSFRSYFTQPVDYELELTIDMPGMEMGDKDHADEKIEWEDTMPIMNKLSTSNDLRWIIKDVETGLENMDINYSLEIGKPVKIRIVNKADSMHPMQHEIHLHGQRFLVLKQDGIETDNFVWKDNVHVPIGSTIDILLDVTNPGDWMAHCHIAEHLESDMMFSFKVI